MKILETIFLGIVFAIGMIIGFHLIGKYAPGIIDRDYGIHITVTANEPTNLQENHYVKKFHSNKRKERYYED